MQKPSVNISLESGAERIRALDIPKIGEIAGMEKYLASRGESRDAPSSYITFLCTYKYIITKRKWERKSEIKKLPPR